MLQDQDFLEKLIIKSMFEDQGYASLVLSTFESDYFDNESAGEIFLKTKNFFTLEKKLPELGLIPGLVNKPDNVKDFLDSTNSIEITLEKSLDVVINESEKFLKKAAVRKAILDSADIVNNDGDYGLIDKNIKQALSKSLKFELGTNYWETLGERLQRMFTDVKRIIPSYYPTLDELISGGFLPRTLSLIAGSTHAGKSQFLINITARQILHGHNCVYFTLEMSEDMVAQRFDSVYSGLDINKIYTDKKQELVTELKNVKQSNDLGRLVIKEFPTKSANVLTLKSYLTEQQYRGNNFDVIFIDYLGLMTPIKDYKKDNSYESLKRISEEVRGMSFEFDCPIITASQINRSGAKDSFSNLSNEDIAESYGLSMTMDFGMAIGYDEDAANYKNELASKIIKNRFGGRVGEEFCFYTDPRSLKVYDNSELEKWMDDALKSGSKERELNQKR